MAPFSFPTISTFWQYDRRLSIIHFPNFIPRSSKKHKKCFALAGGKERVLVWKGQAVEGVIVVVERGLFFELTHIPLVRSRGHFGSGKYCRKQHEKQVYFPDSKHTHPTIKKQSKKKGFHFLGKRGGRVGS